ncbi:MAG: glycosyltransferase [Candidatus Dadabacteria bacterium]|nr:glycosyltransferase [Candidatus Dadabacteria bacterium]
MRTSEKAQQWKAKLVKRFDELKKEGWVEGGYMINHERVAIENLKAGALVYPTEFYEIDFIGGTKAMLGGAIPITTDFAALKEKIKFGKTIHSKRTIDDWADIEDQSYGIRDEDTKEEFIEAIIEYLKNVHNPFIEGVRKDAQNYAKQTYNWDRIINMWDEVLKA